MIRTLLDTAVSSAISSTEMRTSYLLEHEKPTLFSVTVLEIVRGFRRVGRAAQVESFERALTAKVLPFDDASGRRVRKLVAAVGTH